ncbi:MAG: Segregation and condensation protein A [candidate division BRC1 bacterium ADurb.BinA364]|nr:MAG: Segregation and condensation protein A [candidate division BRC1 bacterium ADurb.BinA364]
MAYTINLRVFEGPFDLLLHLVKVNEMDISDINIAEITDQYLKTLELMRELDLEVAGDFVVMAATLIGLKIRALLPDLPGEENEEESEEISEIVSAKALMDQLIEYRRFKELSVDLGQRQEEQMSLFFRNSLLPALQQEQESAPLRGELQLLFDSFARVLRYVESLPHHDVAYEPFSVEERIGQFREQLRSAESMELFSLFRQCRNKPDMIVTFLALLELSRLKEIRLEQGEPFKEVFVFRREDSGQVEDQPVDRIHLGAPTASPMPRPAVLDEGEDAWAEKPAADFAPRDPARLFSAEAPQDPAADPTAEPPRSESAESTGGDGPRIISIEDLS